ncbi:stalk domain-containing protein [Paenibacillus thermotolerans]|uniref:stalk domain-containing protein n=1 Tax=Paenibacillus thermotolerans TaxID=3027807 RepID=UPI002367EB6A|nr:MULTISPECIES: stalk domain-containing protein [unclassified Paenibacillus]
MLGKRSARHAQKIAAAATAGALLFGQPLMVVHPVYAAEAANATTTNAAQPKTAVPVLTLVEEQIVSTGVALRHYDWNGAKVQVIVADLANPYVKLDVISSSTGQPKRDDVLDMSKNAGAIAGINADFFDMSNSQSSALGPEVTGGKFVASPSQGLTGMYAFGITKDNRPIIDTFNFKGVITAAGGQTFAISAVNKTPSSYAMHVYTSAWGSKTRGSNEKTPPTEVLVEDGIVKQISIGMPIDALPPANGFILRATGTGAQFVETNVRIGEPLQVSYQLTSVETGTVYTQDSFQMLVGGHTILVANGQAAAFTRDVTGLGLNSPRSRSAAAFSQDGRYVYLVGVERYGGQGGASLTDLQKLLIQLGAWRAVNLDGGGSTTVVSRPLGDFQPTLVNTPEEGTLRNVINGIGVFTTAPAGEVQGFLIGGASLLWKGETAVYKAKAYDTHYNPVDLATLAAAPVWSLEGNNALVTPGGEVTATAAGNATLSLTLGAAKQTQAIEVADGNTIAKLNIVTDTPPERWVPGRNYKLTVNATLRDGRERAVPPGLLHWERHGIAGTIQGDTLTFTGFTPDAKEAMLVARYDGYSTLLNVPVPKEKLVTDFESVPWMITSSTYPAIAKGSVKLSDVYTTDNDGANKSLALQYDFEAGDGQTNLAAYANLNGENGITLSGTPTAIHADIYGDGNGGWLRGEFVDKNGKLVLITFADKIDWFGWRTVAIDLTNTGALKLKRIYVVSKAKIKGEIAIDNLKLAYPEEPKPAAPQVKMTIGKTTVTVGDQAQKLDQPPIVENNRTYVPLRFIVDALGGELNWNQTEKKVTVRRGGHLIELWVDRLELIADGERITSDAAPIVRKGRTLLPVRLVTEQLGLTVDWNQKAREVTIKEGQ